MDFFEFVCAMTIILSAGFLIFLHIYSKNAIKLQELAEKLRLSAERSKAAKTRYAEPEADLGAWVPELLNLLGVEPDVLFADEMPADLKKLLPLAKGFIQGGGLQKLVGAAGARGEEKGAI